MKQQDFEEAMTSAKCTHFERARLVFESESRTAPSRESQMSATGRGKAKADTVARLNALRVPVAPRIVLIRSRISQEEAELYCISISN